MAEQLNLVQKLAKIRAMSDVVSKEKRGYNYSYADITTILAIWDREDLLDEKDSPVDKGCEVFQKLYAQRLKLR